MKGINLTTESIFSNKLRNKRTTRQYTFLQKDTKHFCLNKNVVCMCAWHACYICQQFHKCIYFTYLNLPGPSPHVLDCSPPVPLGLSQPDLLCRWYPDQLLCCHSCLGSCGRLSFGRPAIGPCASNRWIPVHIPWLWPARRKALTFHWGKMTGMDPPPQVYMYTCWLYHYCLVLYLLY